MERDERRRAEALDRYWDAVQRGEIPPRPAEVDEVAALVVARLAERRPSAPPDALRGRVPLRLMDAMTPKEETMPAQTLSRPHGLPLGPLAPSRWATRSRERRRWTWIGASLATALLLLLTLGLGFLTLGPGRADLGRPTTLPAAVVPAATPATDGTAAETLLRVTLPADVLPRASASAWSIRHYTVPADTRSTWAASDYCCPGLRVDYVVAGTLAVRPTGPAQVVPAGAVTPQAIPAGTQVVLGPGDALLYRVEGAFEAANTGQAPVQLLDVVLQATVPSGAEDAVPVGWVDHDLDVGGLSAPSGAATLRLQRVTLAPGGVLPPPPGTAIQLAVTLVGDVPLGKRSDGSLKNINPEPITLHALSLGPAGAAGGTPTGEIPAS